MPGISGMSISAIRTPIRRPTSVVAFEVATVGYGDPSPMSQAGTRRAISSADGTSDTITVQAARSTRSTHLACDQRPDLRLQPTQRRRRAHRDAPTTPASTVNDTGQYRRRHQRSRCRHDARSASPRVDDAPVAQPDAVSTPENVIGTGSLFADNGSGPDTRRRRRHDHRSRSERVRPPMSARRSSWLRAP